MLTLGIPARAAITKQALLIMDCGGGLVVNEAGSCVRGIWFDSCCFQFFHDTLLFHQLFGVSALVK